MHTNQKTLFLGPRVLFSGSGSGDLPLPHLACWVNKSKRRRLSQKKFRVTTARSWKKIVSGYWRTYSGDRKIAFRDPVALLTNLVTCCCPARSSRSTESIFNPWLEDLWKSRPRYSIRIHSFFFYFYFLYPRKNFFLSSITKANSFCLCHQSEELVGCRTGTRGPCFEFEILELMAIPCWKTHALAVEMSSRSKQISPRYKEERDERIERERKTLIALRETSINQEECWMRSITMIHDVSNPGQWGGDVRTSNYNALSSDVSVMYTLGVLREKMQVKAGSHRSARKRISIASPFERDQYDLISQLTSLYIYSHRL